MIKAVAEEKATGALKLIEKKVIDDVDFLYGVHLRPSQEVENGKAAPAINLCWQASRFWLKR